MRRLLRGCCQAALLGVVLQPSVARALPAGAVVSQGSASVATSGSTTQVTQSTDRAVIDWNSFNVGSGERVNFTQPSAGSVTLNRIHDANPSVIEGQITANGQVWLVNPNGIFFGANAQVNVAGLVATTSDIDNAHFMGGGNTFSKPGSVTATVQNDGSITAAQAGLVALVAPNVINNGTINARLGKVALASGDTFTVDMYGDGLVNLAVSDQVAYQLVKNTGAISASGGVVQMTSAAASQVVNALISNTGVVEANAAGVGKNGTIILYAAGSNAVSGNVVADKGVKSGTSTVQNSGSLSASGLNSGESGGSVTVTADTVDLTATSAIDVSGDAGGGTVRIGGDFHGQGTTATALHTAVETGATINASAITSGNGGSVAVWADNETDFGGAITARGGANAGNGGSVETSAHTLYALGTVDAGAAHGQAGSWLLDPYNVTIAAGAGTNTSITCAGSPSTCTPSADATLYAGNISTTLTGGTSVVITTGAAGASNGDITLATGVNITDSNAGTESLTLSAYRNITFTGTAGITTTNGKLNLILDAATGSNSGYVSMGSGTINTHGGDIYIGGGALDGSGHPLGAAYGNSGQASGIQLTGTTLNANGGDIIMNGYGWAGGTNTVNAHGINFGSATLVETINSGKITLTGHGAGSGSGNVNNGIRLAGTASATMLSAGTGTITLNGTGGSTTGNGNYGVYLSGGGISGNGIINVNGTGGAGTGTSANDYGFYMSGGAITATTAAINITGVGGASPGNTNYGTRIDGGTISSSTGTITLNGTGGGSGASTGNHGIYVTGGLIAPTGAAAIILNGTNGLGTGSFGVDINLSSAANVIRTTGGGSVLLESPGDIILTKANINSTNATAFKFVIDANDASTTSTSGSIMLTTATINTSGGDIWLGGGTLDGNGNPTGASYGDANIKYGVEFTGVGLNAAGGNISIIGNGWTGGTNTSSAYGVVMQIATTVQTTGNGNITITGQAGGSGTGTSNYGLYDAGGSITSAMGAISLTGYGGNTSGTGSGQFGFRLSSGTISSSTGAITITGVGGGGAGTNSNTGLFINGGLIAPTGAAAITLDGTSGAGHGAYFSIGLSPTTAANVIQSANGGTVTLKSSGASSGTISLSKANINSSTGTAFKLVIDGDDTSSTAGSIQLTNASINTSGGQVWMGGGGLNGSGNPTASSNSIDLEGATTLTTNGGTITLAGNSFINNAGAGVLNPGSGRWLVYSTSPAIDTDGGLTAGFIHYSCTYGGACSPLPATGNGFLYSTTPPLSVTLRTPYYIYGADTVTFGYAPPGYLTAASKTADATLANTLFYSVSYTKHGGKSTDNNGVYSISDNSMLTDALGYDLWFAYDGLHVTGGMPEVMPAANAAPASAPAAAGCSAHFNSGCDSASQQK